MATLAESFLADLDDLSDGEEDQEQQQQQQEQDEDGDAQASAPPFPRRRRPPAPLPPLRLLTPRVFFIYFCSPARADGG
jgi:hypothetical protein